ncbi:MAG: iron permease [Verrucomicrobia bacterium]|nr:MAG: iron permease [Verrucomicrobiota bacterium]
MQSRWRRVPKFAKQQTWNSALLRLRFARCGFRGLEFFRLAPGDAFPYLWRMTSAVWLLIVYCALVLLASLAGGWLPLLVRLTHTRLQAAISFVAGLMLGIALLQFLTHATEQLQSVHRAVAWTLAGFLAMFFLQRFFHFHHHDLAEGDPEDCCHDHPEPHAHDHSHTLAERSASQLSWAGTALGLSLHSLLDGLALAAAVTAGTRGSTGWTGFGVALAVILHKPFDAMAVATLMAAGGKTRSSRHWLNVFFALATPLGAGLFFLGASQFADSNASFLGCALAFCAGTFLCIACSDLLPELQFHSHDRVKLSLALLAGLAVALLLAKIESHDAPTRVTSELPAAAASK